MAQSWHNQQLERVEKALCDGAYPSQLPRLLGLSKRTIWRFIKELLASSRIKQVCRYPALFEKLESEKIVPIVPSSGVRSVPESRGVSCLLPHRFGVVWGLEVPAVRWRGGVEHRMRNWSYWVWHEPDFTVMCYPRKVIFWLLVPSGCSVEERMRQGLEAIKIKARSWAALQGCRLGLEGKLLQPVEWIAADLELSKRITQYLNLSVDSKVLAGVEWKVDSSHKPFVELNKPALGDVDKPTDVAKRFEWLLEHGQDGMLKLAEQQNQIIERLQGFSLPLKPLERKEIG